MTTPADHDPAPSTSRRVVVLAAVVALVVGVAGTLLAVRATTSTSVPDFGADAGFARDMQTHHRQAVEMGFLIRDRSTDPAVRTLAYDIITSQQQQAGQMYGWLVQWGLPQTAPAAPMAWVGGEHSAHVEAGEPMQGLASAEQLDTLRAASGVEADRIFLRLMIEHHHGGVVMAEAALADATTDEVLTLAGAIERAQTVEITLMDEMLRERE